MYSNDFALIARSEKLFVFPIRILLLHFRFTALCCVPAEYIDFAL